MDSKRTIIAMPAMAIFFLLVGFVLLCGHPVNAQDSPKPELFSEKWMKVYAEEWNKEPAVAGELAKRNYCAIYAYGFIGDEKPRGFIKVEGGKVTSAGVFSDQTLDYDLRASKSDWEKWLSSKFGLMNLGMAYTARKLRFIVGDYPAAIKDPSWAGPFIKSFEVMGRVK